MKPAPIESSTRDVVLLKIPGQPQYIGIVRLAISGLAARLDLPFDEAEDLKLAVTEACSHMLRSCTSKVELSVEFECCMQEVGITVRSIPAPSPQACQPRLVEGCDSSENGEPDLGVYLIEALVDRVDMQTDDDGAIRKVSMSKRLTGSVEI